MSLQKPIKLISREDEKEMLRAGEELFRNEFPNPERLGCPGSEALRALAFRSQSLVLSDRSQYLDHMTCCSPCFSEFSAYVDQSRHRKRLALIGLCAALLLTLALTVWFAAREWGAKPGDSITHQPPAPVRPEPQTPPEQKRKPDVSPQEQLPEVAVQKPEAKIYRDAILDIRNHGVTRGEVRKPPEIPFPKIPRGLLNLSIYLPIGSEPGKYNLAMYKDPDKPLRKATATARLRRRVAIVRIKVDTSQWSPGLYFLETWGDDWSGSYRYRFAIAEE
jgi:hypothetical protein